MPLVRDIRFENNSRVAIWKVIEDMDYFEKSLQLNPHERAFLQELNPKRQKEWMSSRHLLKDSLGPKLLKQVTKDRFGKPYIKQAQQHISISHSHAYSCLIVSNKIVGIDIQLELDKISRISHKFINMKEWLYIPSKKALDYYHVIWGAKESIYKAYGRKQVDFKKHIHIEAFHIVQDGFAFAGRLTKEKTKFYELRAEKFGQYFLVYAFEISKLHFNTFFGSM